jgi:hypothetical protein
MRLAEDAVSGWHFEQFRARFVLDSPSIVRLRILDEPAV